eukprot:6184065-Pleurochrysis_carterae.AAC.1
MVTMRGAKATLLVVAAYLLTDSTAELRQGKVVPSLAEEKGVVFTRENPGKWLRKAVRISRLLISSQRAASWCLQCSST